MRLGRWSCLSWPLLFFGYAGIFSWIFLSLFKPLSDWTATYMSIGYDVQFIKRGLIGELLTSIFSKPIDILILQKAAIFYLSLSALFLFLFCYLFFKRNVLVGILFFVSGFSLQQFVYDYGRFDQINYILLISSLIFFVKVKSNCISFLVLYMVSTCMLLIHEASLFMQIPTLFLSYLYIAYSNDHPPKFAYMLSLIVIVGLEALAVVYFGRIQASSVDFLLQGLSESLNFTPNKDSLFFLSAGMDSNLKLTIERLLSDKSLSRFAMIMPFVIAQSLLFFKVVKACNLNKSHKYFIFCSLTAIFPMFFLGIDFYRWLSCLCVNSFLWIGVMLYCKGITINIKRRYLLALFTLQLYSGPFGVSVALPDRLALLNFLN